MTSEQRFGFEWNHYDQLDPQYELQFKNWVAPLGVHDFSGKTVLDAGCGMGRNSYWALKWGASEVTAFDYDERTVVAATRNLKEFPNAGVVFKSIYDINWQDSFDIAFSIGVIHHLAYPAKALANMVRAIKPGGILLIWVYGYDGNEWIPKYIDPIRKNITAKLPVWVVYWLAYLFSIPLWLVIKLFHGPTAYLRQLANFKFWHVHSIVFDQLIPTVANYWKRDEVAELLAQLSVANIKIQHPPNGNGWTAIAIKK